jgi:hypothetical protein
VCPQAKSWKSLVWQLQSKARFIGCKGDYSLISPRNFRWKPLGLSFVGALPRTPLSEGRCLRDRRGVVPHSPSGHPLLLGQVVLHSFPKPLPAHKGRSPRPLHSQGKEGAGPPGRAAHLAACLWCHAAK